MSDRAGVLDVLEIRSKFSAYVLLEVPDAVLVLAVLREQLLKGRKAHRFVHLKRVRILEALTSTKHQTSCTQ